MGPAGVSGVLASPWLEPELLTGGLDWAGGVWGAPPHPASKDRDRAEASSRLRVFFIFMFYAS